MAQRSTLEGGLEGTDSSKEGCSEDLAKGQSNSQSQRHSVPPASHPPAASPATGVCITRPAPPRNVSHQYNRICKTHKKLVKSGAVQCSVSLSDTPPTTVNLPPAPLSPAPDSAQLGASVHWGAVGDFSGVQTPFQTPLSSPNRSTVTTIPPPALPPARLSCYSLVTKDSRSYHPHPWYKVFPTFYRVCNPYQTLLSSRLSSHLLLLVDLVVLVTGCPVLTHISSLTARSPFSVLLTLHWSLT